MRRTSGRPSVSCTIWIFEQYPDQHCTKEAQILRERGMDERLVHAVVSHGYLLTVDVQPEHQMEKVLYATDELTGLIGAVVRMLPTKSVQDLQLKSLKKEVQGQKVCRRLLARGYRARCGYARLEPLTS